VTRVAVVGNGGSGKTWFAMRLGAALQVPVVHLDLYRWDAQGRRRDDHAFVDEVRRALDVPSWVADGNYLGTLADRLSHADLVIFLDLPALVCLSGVLRRRVRTGGRRVEDAEHVDRFDIEFVRYVLSYNRSMRPRMIAQLSASDCEVVTVRSRRDAGHLLRSLGVGPETSRGGSETSREGS